MKATIDNVTIDQSQNGTYIVLEAGPTHYGIESAKKLAQIAKDAGANAVASCFIRLNSESKQKKRHLNLKDNLIGCEGAKTLASNIRSYQGHLELNLEMNRLSDEGLVELTQSLAHGQVLILSSWLLDGIRRDSFLINIDGLEARLTPAD